MSTAATDKQIDYIITLWNKTHGGSARFLSQTDIPLSRRQREGGLSKSDASAIIDDLKSQIR